MKRISFGFGWILFYLAVELIPNPGEILGWVIAIILLVVAVVMVVLRIVKKLLPCTNRAILTGELFPLIWGWGVSDFKLSIFGINKILLVVAIGLILSGLSSE